MIKASVLTILLLLPLVVTFANAQSSIQIDTDRDAYRQGDLVVVEGSTPGSGYPVAVEIKDAQGNTIMIRTITADQNGDFELTFKIPSHVEDGPLDIVANVDIEGQTISSTIQTQVSEKAAFQPTSSPGSSNGGCLIATAAYGSELAPQVQLLREIRDNTLLSTTSGASFMTGFNQLYYSFSPTIADWERQNVLVKEFVKLMITPMVSTLSLMSLAENGSEEQVLGIGISIIALNLGMYIVTPTVIGLKIKKHLFKKF